MDKFRGSGNELIALMQRIGSFEAHDLGWQLVLRGGNGEIMLFYVNTGTVQFQGKVAPAARLRQLFMHAAGPMYQFAAKKRLPNG